MQVVKTTSDFLAKVALTCNKIADVEWSGILIYKVTNPEAPVGELDITVVDFFPMSKDTTAHTDFEYGIEHLEYMVNHNLTDCRTGLIHSHNKMGKVILN